MVKKASKAALGKESKHLANGAKAIVQTSSSAPKDQSPVKVKKDLLAKAVKALVQLVEKKSANANPLFDSNSETMTLYFTLTEVPDRRRLKPFMIPLPHSMFDDKSEICFLCKDPQKEYKELLMKKHPVGGVTKVIGVDKLRKNYKTAQQRRDLADAFDLFLCDMAIIELLPKLLGDIFYARKKKAPIPVRVRDANPEENIKKAISGTPMRIPAGPCLGIKVGRVNMGEEHLAANAAAVIAHVVKRLPGDYPVQSITIKSTESPALPIWRRPRPQGDFLNLKKYHSDTSSSAASETGASGGSQGATSDSELVSDAGETLSARDTVSEIDTGGETMDEYVSEVDDSELDSEAGDHDGKKKKSAAKEQMPLVSGLSSKKRRREGKASPVLAAKASPVVAAKTSPKNSPKAAPASMPPPAKKKKKNA